MSKFELRSKFLSKLRAFVAYKASQLPEEDPQKGLFIERWKLGRSFLDLADNVEIEGINEETFLLTKITALLRQNRILEVNSDYRNLLEEEILLAENEDFDFHRLLNIHKKESEELDKNNAENDYMSAMQDLPSCTNQNQSAIKVLIALNSKFYTDVPEATVSLTKKDLMFGLNPGEITESNVGEVSFEAIKSLLQNEEFNPPKLKEVLREILSLLSKDSNPNYRSHAKLTNILKTRIKLIDNAAEKEAQRKREEKEARSKIDQQEESKTDQEKVIDLMNSLERALVQKGSDNSYQKNELEELKNFLDQENINSVRSLSGFTPLYFAVRFNDSKNVANFVNLGADINAQILSESINIRANNRLVLNELLRSGTISDSEVFRFGALEAIKHGKSEDLSLVLEHSLQKIVELPSQEREGFFRSLTAEITKREKSKNNKKEIGLRSEVESFKTAVSQEVKKSKKSTKKSANDSEKIIPKESDSTSETKDPEPLTQQREQCLKNWLDESPLDSIFNLDWSLLATGEDRKSFFERGIVKEEQQESPQKLDSVTQFESLKNLGKSLAENKR